MKITSTDVWTVVVPTIPGRVHSSEFVQETEWDQVPKCIIQLNTDTELCGIGETGRGVPLEDVLTGGSQLLGRNPESLMLQDVLDEPGGSGDHYPSIGQGAVYEAFEMAVFDLVGKARGVPVHALLGGAVRTGVRADYWIGHQTPEDGKRSVERALEAGFKGVKIKCTLEEPMVERLQAMLDVAGPEFKVTVDTNERFYTAPQAIELAHQLQALGNVEVFEDPIPKADLDGFVQIREQIDLPVAMHVDDGPSIIRAVKAEASSVLPELPVLSRPPACAAGTVPEMTSVSPTPRTYTRQRRPQTAPWPPISSAAGPVRTTSSSSPFCSRMAACLLPWIPVWAVSSIRKH